MKIGILQFELTIDGAASLKDKRRVVKSLKDRLRRRFNVAVAEIGALETWNLALLAVVSVSQDPLFLVRMHDKLVDSLQSLRDARLGQVSRRVVDAEQLPESDSSGDDRPVWDDEQIREAERLADKLSVDSRGS